ncbi:hypothetical protein N0X72_17395 [Streptomyces carpaticus]|uniref:hypothetical protein n=1 Tax=Streptomyces carpaticus TaxID=285558 RepID=UPI0021FA9550|nr:hypothetical protein N0X72_17395 [Streptomyces carpaticus]
MSGDAGPWLWRLPGSEPAARRLVVLPGPGASAVSSGGLARALRPHVEVLAVRWSPARRAGAGPADGAAAGRIADALLPYTSGPLAVLAAPSAGRAGAALVRELTRAGTPPVAFFLRARGAFSAARENALSLDSGAPAVRLAPDPRRAARRIRTAFESAASADRKRVAPLILHMRGNYPPVADGMPLRG